MSLIFVELNTAFMEALVLISASIYAVRMSSNICIFFYTYIYLMHNVDTFFCVLIYIFFPSKKYWTYITNLESFPVRVKIKYRGNVYYGETNHPNGSKSSTVKTHYEKYPFKIIIIIHVRMKTLRGILNPERIIY